MTTPRAIVVGSGVAGLTTALALGDCIVITKTVLGDGSSTWAQGGIAAAIGRDDDPGFHAADTVAVAAGLADRNIAELVTAEAPDRIAWLLGLGARFDRRADGDLALGREAGHGRHRIVHANGDATGAELMRTLRGAVRRRHDIEVREHTGVVDLVWQADRIAGVLVLTADGRRDVLLAPAVVLATGGIGRLYAATTNPPEVTGDGLAMAIRAGARIADPEFVQFHPTALRSSLDPMPLLTEALRGAGAVLRDGTGHRFMRDEHADADLAPRDIVARAIWRRIEKGDEVYLDATDLGESFPHRFPTVFESAIDAGVDPRQEWLPVSPAAHYHMGGIAVDEAGRTSLPGLYATGEVSVTGLHGANRLASNSLLEGLVFGVEVATAIMGEAFAPALDAPIEVPAAAMDTGLEEDAVAIESLRRLLWRFVGLMRTDEGLRRALDGITELKAPLGAGVVGRNLAAVARVVTEAALRRTESRGGHHRLDHPRSSASWRHHTIVVPQAESRRLLRTAVRGAA